MATLGTCVFFPLGFIYLNLFSHETRYRIVIPFELPISQRILTLLFKWKAVIKHPKSTNGLSTLKSFRLYKSSFAQVHFLGRADRTLVAQGCWLSVHF